MGTVSIEWDKVAEILSEKSMQVETTGGVRYFGQLERPPRDAEVTVRTTESVETVAIAEVVHITPIEHSFWKRIQGSLSAGFSFTKSSDVAQFNLRATRYIEPGEIKSRSATRISSPIKTAGPPDSSIASWLTDASWSDAGSAWGLCHTSATRRLASTVAS